MSIWTNFNATISLRCGSGCSIQKVLTNINDETVFGGFKQHHNQEIITWTADWRVCIDGSQLTEYVKRLESCIAMYDKNFKMEMYAETRFIR